MRHLNKEIIIRPSYLPSNERKGHYKNLFKAIKSTSGTTSMLESIAPIVNRLARGNYGK